MKFLCPNCSAKYQISDEKVAGRSAKINCRNCGFVIRLAQPSTVAVSSHLAPLRPPEVVGSPSTAEAPARAVRKVPEPLRAAAATPAIPVARTAPTAGPLARRGAPAIGIRLPTEGVREPKGQRVPVPRAAPAAGPTGSAQTSRVRPERLGAAAPGGRTPAESGMSQEERARELLRQATSPRVSQPAVVLAGKQEASGALAGAFANAFERLAPAAGGDEETGSGDEWWVGIQDVPTGPLKLSDVRIKAAQGVVGPDSLVWREGFTDWSPLKKYPELLAVIEEARSRAASSPSLVPSPAPQAATTTHVAFSDPFKSTPVEASPAVVPAGAAGLHEVLDELAGLPKAPRVPPAAWLAVGVALICGFTGGFVVFGGGGPSATSTSASPVQGAQALAAAPAASGETQTPPAKAPEGTEGSALDERASTTGSNATTKRNDSSAKNAAASSAPTAAAQGQGLTGLRGLSAVRGSGPTGKAEGHGSGSSSSQGLDADTVQKTVSRYKGSVNRSCWQPALDTRDRSAPTTARVSVTLVVSPGGQVQSVSTGGDPAGYRGLARCIESRVRGWQFPASGSSTTVNVPFVFAAQ